MAATRRIAPRASLTMIPPGRWIPILSIVALYAPTLARLAAGPWQESDGSYSPIVLALALGISVTRPGADERNVRPAGAAVAVLATGIVMLMAGRFLGNITIEFGSSLLTIMGMLAALNGWSAVRRRAYAFAALLIAVPLPGSIVTALTFPLKMGVTQCAEQLLRLARLPVAREGIMLDIGDYRLLVVDACSGLQSMFSLIASAVVYLALAGPRPPWRIVPILATIAPIAFLANVVRVTTLALITYVFGDAAGQGFLHDFAGMLMFVLAFGGLMLVDRIAAAWHARKGVGA